MCSRHIDIVHGTTAGARAERVLMGGFGLARVFIVRARVSGGQSEFWMCVWVAQVVDLQFEWQNAQKPRSTFATEHI